MRTATMTYTSWSAPVTETVLEPVLDDNGQPVLDDNGQIVMAEVVKPVLDENGNPVTEWVAEVEIVYDWLRVDYPGEATRLDASAGEDISIRETTGDLGVGNVSAGGDVSLSAPGSILDTREDGETQGNLVSGGDATLTSDEGTIGTSEEYLDIDVDGTTTARAEGDINIADRADLDLVADTAEGQVNATPRATSTCAIPTPRPTSSSAPSPPAATRRSRRPALWSRATRSATRRRSAPAASASPPRAATSARRRPPSSSIRTLKTAAHSPWRRAAMATSRNSPAMSSSIR